MRGSVRGALRGAALPALAALALLAAAAPASAGANAYRHYGACGLSPKAKPSHSCARSRPKGAFFRSNRETVHYTVCVRFPGNRTLCAKGQLAEKGRLYVNRITAPAPGRHRITWFVGGKRVGRFALWVRR